VLVRRGEPLPATPSSGPIYVCTRNDALEGIIAATPPNRREDLVFLQNGMLGEFLFEQGLPDASQVLACTSPCTHPAITPTWVASTPGSPDGAAVAAGAEPTRVVSVY